MEVREQVVGVSSLPHGIWESSLDHQAPWQVPLSAEPFLNGVLGVELRSSHWLGRPFSDCIVSPAQAPLFCIVPLGLLLSYRFKVVGPARNPRGAGRVHRKTARFFLPVLGLAGLSSLPLSTLFLLAFGRCSLPLCPLGGSQQGHTHCCLLKQPCGRDHSSNKTFSCLRFSSNSENSRTIT